MRLLDGQVMSESGYACRTEGFVMDFMSLIPEIAIVKIYLKLKNIYLFNLKNFNLS